MNWNEWEFVWRRQAPAPLGSLNAADVDARRRKMARIALVRDLAEAGAGLFVSVILARLWISFGRDGWPIGIAIGLTLAVSAVFVRERVTARRSIPGMEATLLERLDGEIAELRHQRKLLHSIGLWYLLPLALSQALVVLAIGLHLERDAAPGLVHGLLHNPWTASFILGYLFGVSPLCFAAVLWVNRRAVRQNLDPKIGRLESLRETLTAAPNQNHE
jgi:hypothetical protein